MKTMNKDGVNDYTKKTDNYSKWFVNEFLASLEERLLNSKDGYAYVTQSQCRLLRSGNRKPGSKDDSKYFLTNTGRQVVLSLEFCNGAGRVRLEMTSKEQEEMKINQAKIDIEKRCKLFLRRYEKGKESISERIETLKYWIEDDKEDLEEELQNKNTSDFMVKNIQFKLFQHTYELELWEKMGFSF